MSSDAESVKIWICCGCCIISPNLVGTSSRWAALEGKCGRVVPALGRSQTESPVHKSRVKRAPALELNARGRSVKGNRWWYEGLVRKRAHNGFPMYRRTVIPFVPGLGAYFEQPLSPCSTVHENVERFYAAAGAIAVVPMLWTPNQTSSITNLGVLYTSSDGCCTDAAAVFYVAICFIYRYNVCYHVFFFHILSYPCFIFFNYVRFQMQKQQKLLMR